MFDTNDQPGEHYPSRGTTTTMAPVLLRPASSLSARQGARGRAPKEKVARLGAVADVGCCASLADLETATDFFAPILSLSPMATQGTTIGR
jgi:hypothetical protein